MLSKGAFETKWVHNYNDVVSYYNTNGKCHIPCWFVTVEGNKLGNWVHYQRKKFKSGQLTDDRINLLSDLQFEFSAQANVVGAKLTVPVAISKIFKYKKENGNISKQRTIQTATSLDFPREECVKENYRTREWETKLYTTKFEVVERTWNYKVANQF
jgi:hypothetical protein